MKILEDIERFVFSNSSFTLDGDVEDFEEGDDISFSCRENGDVGAERHSIIDYREGVKLVASLKEEFSSVISDIQLVTCDEWVMIEIVLK